MRITKKNREEIAGLLLDARGWISCWFPIGMEEELDDECAIGGVRAGSLKSAMRYIDKVLAIVGHTENGEVKP